MSSVSEYKKCEQCGGVVYEDYNCRTGESYSSCKNCGKTRVFYLERDAEGEPLMDINGKYLTAAQELPGFGAFSFRWEGIMARESGPLEAPWPGDFETFYASHYASNRGDLVEAECYVTTFRDGRVERVWGGADLPVFGDEKRGYC